MKVFSILAAGSLGLVLAGSAFAAGTGGNSTAVPSCKKGEVYDKKKKACVEAERAPDDALFDAAVTAAYDGRFQDAIDLLRLADNSDDPRVLNYLGFAHRKMGLTEMAMGYYLRALEIDPNYDLARSYMGQGLVADGDIDGAKVQLAEIRNRGGADSWAYVMLENAIVSGVVY